MRKRDTQKKYSAQCRQLKSANESTLQLRAGAHMEIAHRLHHHSERNGDSSQAEGGDVHSRLGCSLRSRISLRERERNIFLMRYLYFCVSLASQLSFGQQIVNTALPKSDEKKIRVLSDTKTSPQSLAPDNVAGNQRIGGFIRLEIVQLRVDWQSPKPVQRDFYRENNASSFKSNKINYLVNMLGLFVNIFV